jgi:hypothetical protein
VKYECSANFSQQMTNGYILKRDLQKNFTFDYQNLTKETLASIYQYPCKMTVRMFNTQVLSRDSSTGILLLKPKNSIRSHLVFHDDLPSQIPVVFIFILQKQNIDTAFKTAKLFPTTEPVNSSQVSHNFEQTI